MKYYKLKTVAFYIFVATVISFDLKGSEKGMVNENEGNCPCCNCCKEEEKKEEEKNNENKEDTKDKKKEGEKKEEEKKEGEGGDEGGYEGGDEGEEEEEGEDGGEEEGEGGGEKEEEGGGEEDDEDKEKNFISVLKQCFEKAINEEKYKKYFENNKKTKKRLFIVDLKNVLNEIIFEKLDDNLSKLFSYKESVTEKNLLLGDLSLISYCPKDENNKESKILEFKMDHFSTINQVFDHFKHASTLVNEECLILFIKDKYSNIVPLVHIDAYDAHIYTIYKENK